MERKINMGGGKLVINKRAFTLIELLAVIVILAIIALIAVPIILNIIEDSKRSAIERSAELYLDAVNNTISKEILKDTNYNIEDGKYSVMNDGNICIGTLNNNICEGNILKIDVDKKRPTGEIVKIENNVVIEYKLIIDGVVISNLSKTPDYCFEITDNKDGTGIISSYKCGKDNSYGNEEILDVEIPEAIYYKGIKSATFDFDACGMYYSYEGLPDQIIMSRCSGAQGLVENNDFLAYVNSYGEMFLTDIEYNSEKIKIEIKEISNDAFAHNQLTSVTIPDSVTTIGEQAFYNNKLNNVTVGNSVMNIGAAAFNDNQLPENQAFIYKRNSNGSIDNTTVVSYGGKIRENLVIPSNIASIELNAFAYNQLTSVTISDSVTTIGEQAFYDNELTNVIIGKGVKSIRPYAFAENQLTSITIPNGVTSIEDAIFKRNQLESINILGNVTSIGDYAFESNNLTSITIPDSVTSIGYNAFSYNKIESVTIPDNVESLGGFSDNQLTSLTIPSRVTSITGGAFSNNRLVSVEIPDNVLTIGNSAFASNPLKNVTIGSGITEIGVAAFTHNSFPHIKINTSRSKVKVGQKAFGFDETYSTVEWLG